MAERRQFPIEHGEQARLGRMENHIVEPVVAVDDRHAAVVSRRIAGEPGDEIVHRGNRLGFGGAVLVGPALELALEIGAGAAEVGQADPGGIERGQRRERAVHLVVDFRAVLARDFRQVRLPEDAALDALHDVEGRADDAVVLAQQVHFCDGHASVGERLLHAVLAIDGVRGFQQHARRLAAQHIGAAGGLDQESRV